MTKNKTSTLVTRDFSALNEPTSNIYEAVAIISKRARQVALHMKEDLDKKLADFVTDDIEEIHDEEKAAKQEQAEITRLYEKQGVCAIVSMKRFNHSKKAARSCLLAWVII
jgi:DNA-directed RNA polymerase subunit K/omega